MNKSDKIFRINVGFLINQPIGYDREIPFDLAHFSFDETLTVEDFMGTLNLNRTQNGLRVIGKFNTKTKVTCGRCLEDFTLKLDSQFEEIFTFENKHLSEDESLIPENGNVDFEPYIRDYLMLEIPINPVCKDDCRGLCDICGENLNNRDCGHEHEKPLTSMAQSMKAIEGSLYPGKNAPIKK